MSSADRVSVIAEPLALDPAMTSAAARQTRVQEMLELVRLPVRLAGVFPHELTAGEQKRVGMARAWRRGPISWSSTNRPPRWTSASAPRSST
ncbi:hypothetical protein [Paracoccus shandongensis]|uniref:hypothetical protein n=1 Tax=Paracoccus shandongensis TaxID=2816048 RepID=UPI001A8DC34A|nr:hypothetical protein [Paracoccus shandongensis]